MLNHVALDVCDLAKSRGSRQRELDPLGYSVGIEIRDQRGFRSGEGALDFWICARNDPSAPRHVAFRSPDRQTVDATTRPQSRAGGVRSGVPGLRPEYHESYYAAFVLAGRPSIAQAARWLETLSSS